MFMKRSNLFNLVAAVTLLALAAFPTAAFADTDTTAPAVSAVAAAPNPAIYGDTITLTATVDDSASGASNIDSAEYNIDGGSYSTMSAVDGAFDTATENVTASFAAPTVGDHQLCVRGTDASKNTSADSCISLTVQSIYKFGGFKPPVRSNMVNKANAPRTIPIKFRLTKTADGSVVSDPSAITAVKSYQVDCTSLTGDSSTAVVEKSPGKSGLRYLNLGNWIFNWKTDKSYAGTCRNLFIVFADGSTSPEVTFQFR
jgi:hypothetical protein